MALANKIENEEVVGDMQSLPPVAKNTVKYVYEKVSKKKCLMGVQLSSTFLVEMIVSLMWK